LAELSQDRQGQASAAQFHAEVVEEHGSHRFSRPFYCVTHSICGIPCGVKPLMFSLRTSPNRRLGMASGFRSAHATLGSGGEIRDSPPARTARVRPPPCNAPRWTQPSIPRGSPLETSLTIPFNQEDLAKCG
jgi:hypothetical protein